MNFKIKCFFRSVVALFAMLYFTLRSACKEMRQFSSLRWLRKAFKLRCGCASLALLGVFLCAFEHEAQAANVVATSLSILTNLPAQVVGGSTSNLFTPGGAPTNNIIDIWQGVGVGWMINYKGTNAASSAGPLVINWSGTTDGTNWSTSPVAQSVGNAFFATGTSNSITVSNFTASILNNMVLIAPMSITNGMASTNCATNISAQASQGNVPGSSPF